MAQTCVVPSPDRSSPLTAARTSLRGVAEVAAELLDVLAEDGALDDEVTREWTRASIRLLKSVTADACLSLGEAVEEHGR